MAVWSSLCPSVYIKNSIIKWIFPLHKYLTSLCFHVIINVRFHPKHMIDFCNCSKVKTRILKTYRYMLLDKSWIYLFKYIFRGHSSKVCWPKRPSRSSLPLGTATILDIFLKVAVTKHFSSTYLSFYFAQCGILRKMIVKVHAVGN